MNLNPPSIVPFSLNRDLESTASVLLSAARMVATMECLPELPRLQHARALREGIAAMRRAGTFLAASEERPASSRATRRCC